MKYDNICEAIFVSRPNRFVANVKIGEEIETVHVKNTGRCDELLIPDARVILQAADGTTERKTKYDLIAVYRQDYGWINIDSQAPNVVVKEWLENNNPLFENITLIKPEFKHKGSRIDFYVEQGEEKILLEVKGCTLVKCGTCFFPDAPTERGVKHLRELTEAVKEGYSCYIAFVIQVNNLEFVLPNREVQPEFAVALREAIQGGVKVLFISCEVTEDTLDVRKYRVKSFL